jgi:haloacid dehalogenase superfamily, subfamily IA, variant 3 with third motif having DD or ED
MFRLVLFDLDDTLYPESSGMNRDITQRMVRYVANYLGMEYDQALRFRRERAHKYGTTLEWLRAEHGFTDVEDYFAAVHPDGEEYCIQPNPGLAAMLDGMSVHKAVLTNSPSEHANRVLRKLGLEGRFEAVHDIRFNNLKGKPHAEAYRRSCEALGVKVEETLFVDDFPKYVRGFQDIGGRAVLIDEAGRFAAEGLPSIRSLSELPALASSL